MTKTQPDWQRGSLVELKTERFVLRTATREDVSETFLSWLADPEVMLGLNLPRQRLSRQHAVRYVLSHDNDTKFFLLICAPDKDAIEKNPIGFFTVTVDHKNSVAETSVVVGDRDYWGKNVVIETRSVLLDFLFTELDMFKVIGRPHGRNMSSIFNYKALGFECEAVLREQVKSVDGKSRLDQLVFAMFKRDWRTNKKGKPNDGLAESSH